MMKYQSFAYQTSFLDFICYWHLLIHYYLYQNQLFWTCFAKVSSSQFFRGFVKRFMDGIWQLCYRTVKNRASSKSMRMWSQKKNCDLSGPASKCWLQMRMRMRMMWGWWWALHCTAQHCKSKNQKKRTKYNNNSISNNYTAVQQQQ